MATLRVLLPATSVAIVIGTVVVQVTGAFHVRWYAYFLEAATIGLAFSPLGALILRRHTEHRVGWLFVGLGVFGAVQATLGQAAHWVGGSAGNWLAVGSEGIRISGFVGIVALLLLYPTGQLLSRRWRIVLVAGGFFFFAAAAVVLSPLDVSEFAPLKNPINTAAVKGIVDFANMLSQVGFVALLVAVASLFVRFVRSRSIERQQIKLFAWSAALSVVVIAGANAAFPAAMEEEWLGSIVWNIPLVALPGAAATAILRHGLYDIDRIVSRTLGYAIVTAFLGGIFVLVALGPAAIAGSRDNPDWVIAIATLLVIALFRPVRRRVQGAIDRRFDRARYDASRTIEAFSAHLREEVDLDALGAELRDVVARTMQPTHVALWVRTFP